MLTQSKQKAFFSTNLKQKLEEHNINTRSDTHTHTHTHTYIYIHIYIYIYIDIYIYIYGIHFELRFFDSI